MNLTKETSLQFTARTTAPGTTELPLTRPSAQLAKIQTEGPDELFIRSLHPCTNGNVQCLMHNSQLQLDADILPATPPLRGLAAA